MKRLILMRHAKSSWTDPYASDHDRPLNGRGKRSADAIGAWMCEKDYIPDEVLSSDAERTRETWQRVTTAFDAPATPSWHRALYLAGTTTMLEHLKKAKHTTVMMIGHNPGIASFAAGIVKSPPNDPEFCRYPTAATLVCDFDIDNWAQADWAQAEFVDFIVPRRLGIN